MDSASLEIPISKLVDVVGHKGTAIAPKLEVKWTDQSGATRVAEFVQQMTGGSRRKNLNDWAKVIEKLKAKQLKITPLPPAPGIERLQGTRRPRGHAEAGLMTTETGAEAAESTGPTRSRPLVGGPWSLAQKIAPRQTHTVAGLLQTHGHLERPSVLSRERRGDLTFGGSCI
jgi:hypothetical protein